MSSSHPDAKGFVRRVLSRATHQPPHSSGMFWKKDVGEHSFTTHLAQKYQLLLWCAEVAFPAQESPDVLAPCG